ncbi:tetratricopeptide repeat protein [Haloferula chungangensis]|uniref:Tetratricopeptide repeat protein n=1 Tax=Haloferula chungangensis TaxID=1048331 RepID=A0ABW2L2X1_9BACT
MKSHLIFLLSASFCVSGLYAQSDSNSAPEAASSDQAMLPWQKEFLNLPEDQRVEFGKHMNKSRELFGQKRVFECIEELGKAQAIFDNSPDVENLLGACQVEFRAFDKAMQHFERANELQPGEKSIQFNIAELYFVTKQWEKAEETLAALVERSKAEESKGRSLMMQRLVEFKLMLTRIKLGKMEEAKQMAELYDHLDDSPYCYFAEAAIAYQNEDELTAEMAMARAGRIFRDPAIISPWQDTMMEFGYMKSFFGGDLPEEE